MTTRNTSRAKRIVVMGSIVAASLIAAVPNLTSATGVGPVKAAATSTTVKAAATSTTVKAAATVTTIKATTTGKTVAHKYEVVAGIFATKAEAQAQIDALTKAKFVKFTIKPVTKKFAVVKASLTRAQAKKLAKQINANATLGKARIKKLS